MLSYAILLFSRYTAVEACETALPECGVLPR